MEHNPEKRKRQQPRRKQGPSRRFSPEILSSINFVNPRADTLTELEKSQNMIRQLVQDLKNTKFQLKQTVALSKGIVAKDKQNALKISQLQAELKTKVGVQAELRQTKEELNQVQTLFKDKEVEVLILKEAIQEEGSRLQACMEEVESLKTQLTESEQEVRRLNKELEDGKVALSRIEQQHGSLQVELGQLRHELAEQRKQNEVLLKVRSDLRNQEFENRKKQENFNRIVRESEAKQLQVNVLSQQLAISDKKRILLDTEVDKLKLELTEYRKYNLPELQKTCGLLGELRILCTVKQTQLRKVKSSLTQFLAQVGEAFKQVKAAASCMSCGSEFKKSFLITPCAHIFCVSCKYAFARECSRCGPFSKVEGVHELSLVQSFGRIMDIVERMNQYVRAIADQSAEVRA